GLTIDSMRAIRWSQDPASPNRRNLEMPDKTSPSLPEAERDRGRTPPPNPSRPGAREGDVGLGAAVVEEAPGLLQGADAGKVAVGEDKLLAGAAPRQDGARRVSDERAAPERDGALAASAVDRRHIDVVDRRVADLGVAPHLLPVAGDVLFNCLVDEADRRRVDEDFGALERGETGRLGIPLVIADQRRDAAGRRVEDANAGVAGAEVMLLVIEDVLGKVRLGVGAEQCPRLVEEGRRVEEAAVRGALEDRPADQDDAVLLRRVGEGLRGRTRDGLGEVEGAAVVGLLAEVRAAE